MNALGDQGSDVNVMPLSTYMKLTDERPTKTDIRLSLASHSYIYPLGIADDVLVEVTEHVYPVDFVILDIKEDEKRPFILGIPFLTTAKDVIKFDKGTITLRFGNSKISFHRIPESLFLEWEEKIKLHQEKEMEFDRLRNKNFKNERHAPVKIEDKVDDEGEVTLYLTRRSLEVLRKFHWTILGGRSNKLSHVSSLLLSKPGVVLVSFPCRKAHLLEDKQISNVGVFDEVFFALEWLLEEIHVNWAHLEKKQTKITDLHQMSWRFMQTVAGDSVASIKRRRRDLSSDGIRNLARTSGRGRLKEDLESSTWRRHQDYKATPSRFRNPAFVCIAIDMSRETRVV
ncbi:reverse transcriptase domain-containing protein [Tanacetum coccineum]|uniref:Reverse transcriptase domain-containing protein n=1 Tax=Tanacetum coccineum TaxID=301880 RepID=A0ABQ5F7P4_9ASTR